MNQATHALMAAVIIVAALKLLTIASPDTRMKILGT